MNSSDFISQLDPTKNIVIYEVKMLILRDKKFGLFSFDKSQVKVLKEDDDEPLPERKIKELLPTNVLILELERLFENGLYIKLRDKIPLESYEFNWLGGASPFRYYIGRNNYLILYDMDAREKGDAIILKDNKLYIITDYIDIEPLTKNNLIDYFKNNYEKFQLDEDGDPDYEKGKIKRDPKNPEDKSVIDYTNYVILFIKTSKI